MPNQIICVYQDCPLCGERGKKLKKLIYDRHLDVRKVSFASPEGRELCYRAVTEHKIGKMPFFTDGEIFSTDIQKFCRKPVEKPKKITKKSTKNKKGVVDEPVE